MESLLFQGSLKWRLPIEDLLILDHWGKLESFRLKGLEVPALCRSIGCDLQVVIIHSVGSILRTSSHLQQVTTSSDYFE